ncbi:MAG: flippase-like domain-containing protein [Lachnospiraceae bacterium]|nr:flippase-like domain-containing protein [Lachnospiraceae bacterium]
MGENTPKKKKSWIWTLLFVLLNVGVLLWIGLSELKRRRESGTGFADISIRWIFFALSVLCFLIMLLSESGKLYSLIKRLTQKKDFPTAVKATVYGYYYDNITPSGAGGQPFQIMYLRKRGLPNGASLAIPVYSFLIYQITFVLTAGLVFLLFHNTFDYPTIRVTANIGLFCCSLIPLGIILAAVFPRVMAKIVMVILRGLAALRIIKNPEEKGDKIIRHLTEYSEAINYINKHRRLSLEMILLSVLFHVARCSLPYFILRSFGAEADYLYTLVATYYLYAAIKIIPTPGGAGAAEASFYLIFSELPEPGLIFWAMLVWRFFCDYIFLLGGMALTGWDYLMEKRRLRRLKRQQERDAARQAREEKKETRRLEREALEKALEEQEKAKEAEREAQQKAREEERAARRGKRKGKKKDGESPSEENT